MEKSQLPGVAGRGRERPRGPSVLESVMDPGRSHDLGISHVGAAASSTEKCGTQAGRGLEDPLVPGTLQRNRQKGEGLPCDTAGHP